MNPREVKIDNTDSYIGERVIYAWGINEVVRAEIDSVTCDEKTLKVTGVNLLVEIEDAEYLGISNIIELPVEQHMQTLSDLGIEDFVSNLDRDELEYYNRDDI